MKKVLLLILCISLFTNAQAAYDKPITFEKLPVASQQFIKKYFPNHKVAIAKKEIEFIGVSYDVIFTNGDKVEFSKNGDWTEVKCKSSGVPDEIIFPQILSYVNQNYPDAQIIEIERKARYTSVELSNKIELKFNKAFQLIEIDD